MYFTLFYVSVYICWDRKKAMEYTLHKKCPYLEFFWSIFSRIRTEYRPEKLQYGHFSRSDSDSWANRSWNITILQGILYCYKNKYLDERIVKVLSVQLHKDTCLIKHLFHKVCHDLLEVKNNTKFISWFRETEKKNELLDSLYGIHHTKNCFLYSTNAIAYSQLVNICSKSTIKTVE